MAQVVESLPRKHVVYLFHSLVPQNKKKPFENKFKEILIAEICELILQKMNYKQYSLFLTWNT
jgi:hypothetical protein